MLEKNLKYYRLKKNMTIKELADACGVSPMAISYYENGKRKPDIETINKLAEILGVFVVDFLASSNSNVTFKHCEFRKNSSLSKGQQEFIQESVEEYFGRFFDAVDCIGGNPLPEPIKCHSIPRTGDIEEDAKQMRKYLGFSEEGPIDELICVLENKGVFVIELDIQNDHFSGINGFVNDYPYIAINKNIRAERKRTTILHEVAHLLFIWDEKEEKQNEKDATAIAGAILIPQNDLVRELGIRRTIITKDLALVCREYGISMLLLVKRAAIVGIINASIEKSFYVKANKVNYRVKEPNRVINLEEPNLFKQLVFRAVNEEGISIQRGAELLKIPISEMEEYCGLMEV